MPIVVRTHQAEIDWLMLRSSYSKVPIERTVFDVEQLLAQFSALLNVDHDIPK